MTIQDDETLQMYLEESLEHLANIENDFLAIEENGANIDEDLVNKVYRAAHSIKGGAGFMGLTNIKDLTHEMENILGKIRAGEMTPTTDIVNVLLDASDQLKALMNDVLNSNDVDISAHIKALQDVLAGKIEAAPKTAPEAAPVESTASEDPVPSEPRGEVDTETIELMGEDGLLSLKPSAAALAEAHAEVKCVYLIHLDIAADIVAKSRSLAEVLIEMDQTGTILASSVDLPPIANIEAGWSCSCDTLNLLFATILKPGDINVLFNMDPNRIRQLTADNQLLTLTGEPVGGDTTATQIEEPEEVAAKPEAQETAVAETLTENESEAVETDPPEATVTEPAGTVTNMAKAGAKPALVEQETSLRVHVSLLDQLMTLAGELVLSRNQLLQSMTSDDHRASEIAGQRIDLITSELQEAIMLTRMQSIGNVFNKFPRVVRDLARNLGKKIELTLEGKDVELDKTIIEAIGDPLTHLVRNAVDHGIERTDVRRQNRKAVVGQIYLKAYHEAGQVNIEIADDGKGLDGDLIAQKAIEKGLISEDQVKVMSDKDRVNLIFLPGLSTAEKVTDVSGRGVGMDVVKTNLDKLGGLIDIESEKGKGSTIRIKLPLTLAIIPCQVVYTGGERYAIPQVNLEELLRIPADQVRKRIERVGDAEVVRLRGDLLPLVKLADIIGVNPLYHDPKTNTYRPDRRRSITDKRETKTALFTEENDAAETVEEQTAPAETEASGSAEKAERRYRSASALNIVVVSTGTMKYGLVVDELHDSEEIVVKPLGRDLKRCRGYAGATIMGDGRVALILDVSNLARMAGLTAVENSIKTRELQAAESHLKENSDRQSLLIFRSAEEEQFAAPLNLVERIEKIKASDIEEVGGKRVMQYRGGSLPLFSIDEAAMVKPLADSDNLLVIVFIVAGREVGLLAIGPVDAMETRIDVDPTTLKQTGIMGSAIINDHTTLLIDMYEIVQTLNPEWFIEQANKKEEDGGNFTILFAEDSNFFRNQVKGSMEDEGYHVIEAEDGAIAWDLLQEKGDEIRLVVTDIEMPNMNGFELTQRIKGHPAFGHLPVIALTTLAGEEDVARGQEVGIDDYQIKLDREKLLKSIYEHLQAAMV